MQRSPNGTVAYLAPEGFLPQLQEELGRDAREVYGNLILAPAPTTAALR